MDYWQLPEFEVAMIEQQRRDQKNNGKNDYGFRDKYVSP